MPPENSGEEKVNGLVDGREGVCGGQELLEAPSSCRERDSSELRAQAETWRLDRRLV